tara:strand:- start:181557 stop:182162 length:606 start_codon:yes stop_codon:yes gene_type:complete
MVASKPLIYVIRHGETDWNLEARLQGTQDIPLNATGRRQASYNGQNLKDILGKDVSKFDFVASPMKRTRETMELVRKSMSLEAGDYRLDDRLIEVSFGDWEGHTLDELAVHVPDRVKQRSNDKWNFIPPGENAESYEILAWRIGAWLKDVTSPTVCVSHGGVIRTLFHLIAGTPGNEAADLPTPQDRILKIEGDSIQWIDD